MDLAIKLAQLLLSLSLLVILHELGHFIPAKLFKTKVEKFFLFFDLKFALFKKKIGDTIYGIGWLPLGGYVKIAGMIDESMDKEQMAKPTQPWEFRSKPAWQRLIIMLGGVTVNLIVGFVIYAMILFYWGSSQIQQKDIPNGYHVSNTLQSYGFQNGDIPIEINGIPIEDTSQANRFLLFRDVQNITIKRQDGQVQTLSVPDSIGKQLFQTGEMFGFVPRKQNVIDTILVGMPAHQSGLLKGDVITSVNHQNVAYFDDIVSVLSKAVPNEPITIEIQREGQPKVLEVTPNENRKLGFDGKPFDFGVTKKEYSFAQAIKEGGIFGYWTLRDYVSQFKYVFTKKGASQVGGFGSMANMFASQWDWKRFWETTAFISIALAFMNLLPIPALDGGHVVFLLYEMVTRRKPNEKVLEYAQIIGIIFILFLFVFANGNDLYKGITSWLAK